MKTFRVALEIQKIKTLLLSNSFIPFIALFLISGLVYLPFISQFGYYKDDWYLMYAAGTKGPLVFNEIFSIDRPWRALVMIPSYAIFGPNPLYYNLAAYVYRLLGALGFFWTLCLLWPRNRLANLSAALLFVIYPGFLSQPNAIDYQSHLSGLAAGMISIALTIKALTVKGVWAKAILFLGSILLGLFYLSQIEWYIGLEVFRWGCIFFIFLRQRTGFWKASLNTIVKGSPVLLISAGFLIWRLYFFESVRGATNVDLQLEGFLSSPLDFVMTWPGMLLNDIWDSVILAWFVPFRRLNLMLSDYEWLPGLGIAFLVLLTWIVMQSWKKPEDADSNNRSSMRRDAIWLGLILVIFGLLPVIMVGRSVDFKNFSRYTLVASAGVALLWQAGVSLLPNALLRNAVLGILLVLASLTHYVNGLAHVHETERISSFWWQVSWRVPQMTVGATLVANFSNVVVEEDYFVWGPANLIYYPESLHADYPQPGIYAVLRSDETVEKVVTLEERDFSNRRGIRTYPNYRNILILTQPTLDSCVQVMDGSRPELSSREDPRIIQISTFSEADQILFQETFRKPPEIPFGEEPAHLWCYYYEKATFARQAGDWKEVLRLGEEAFEKGYTPRDQIEWIPFLQAYAISRKPGRLAGIAPQLTDPPVRDQACQILQDTDGLSSEVRAEISRLFCDG